MRRLLKSQYLCNMNNNKSGMLKYFCLMLLLLLPFCVTAQTEAVGSQGLKGLEDFISKTDKNIGEKAISLRQILNN